MKIFSTDGEFAFLSVGQFALGIIAIGQVARGLVAIGQVAVGVLALGQVAVSIVGAGMVGIGVGWFAGLGLGGRGKCLRLIPRRDPPRVVPPLVRPDELAGAGTGCVRASVVPGVRAPRLAVAGQALKVRLTPRLVGALDRARSRGHAGEVYAFVRSTDGGLVCDRVAEVPGQRRAIGVVTNAVRLTLLAGIAIAWWGIALLSIGAGSR